MQQQQMEEDQRWLEQEESFLVTAPYSAAGGAPATLWLLSGPLETLWGRGALYILGILFCRPLLWHFRDFGASSRPKVY